MRDDYFTLDELTWTVRLRRETVRRIFDEYADFPVMRIGNRYIIPKMQFFRWYARHKRDGTLRHRFDAKRIDEERETYFKRISGRAVI